MGAFAAVAQGSDVEPRMIVLRYRGGDNGPHLGFVGKAVTFDTGGISIKPSARMQEMKFDMSGGAAVIESMDAIAQLELPVTITAVVPSTENMPSGAAMKPGDIVTAMNGKTIEVNNTDAEGRLILADALCYAVEQGVERIVDLATLTGAIIVALGSTYAGFFSNDDDWYAEVEAAANASRRAGLAAAPPPRVLRADQGRVRGPDQLVRGAQGALQLRRRVPAPVRGRHAVGAHGHRRHRLEHRPPLHAQGRVGIRHAHAHRARPPGRGILTALRLLAAAVLAAALLAGCGGTAELSDQEGQTLESARERLDDAIDTEETLRTDEVEARRIAREVRRRQSQVNRLEAVVPSLVTVNGRVDREAVDEFLANATSDAPAALHRPAAREVGRMVATLEDKDAETKIAFSGQTADAYLAEAGRDVEEIWPDLARRLAQAREDL